jgi:gamma-carbonic anhydrase
MILPWNNHYPKLGTEVYIAEGVKVVGRVTVGDHASIWFNCVVRGDVNVVEIGKRSNIQDLSVCHQADDFPLIIGDEVVVGHAVTLHGCTVENGALIGIGATVLNGAVIGCNAMVASQSLVPEGMKVPPGTLVRGIPARVARDLTDAEIKENHWLAEKYVRLSRMYMGLTHKPISREHE